MTGCRVGREGMWTNNKRQSAVYDALLSGRVKSWRTRKRNSNKRQRVVEDALSLGKDNVWRGRNQHITKRQAVAGSLSTSNIYTINVRTGVVLHLPHICFSITADHLCVITYICTYAHNLTHNTKICFFHTHKLVVAGYSNEHQGASTWT